MPETLYPYSHNEKKPYDRDEAFRFIKERFDASVAALDELKRKYPGCSSITMPAASIERAMIKQENNIR